MNNPHDYEDLFEVEQKDGKHPLNNKSSNEVADRIKKTGLILVIVLGLILGCGAMAFSWVRSKLHTAPVEQNIESERKIMDAPENIGKPKTLPTTPTREDNQAEEKPDDKPPEPTATVAVTASNTQAANQNKEWDDYLYTKKLRSYFNDTLGINVDFSRVAYSTRLTEITIFSHIGAVRGILTSSSGSSTISSCARSSPAVAHSVCTV